MKKIFYYPVFYCSLLWTLHSKAQLHTAANTKDTIVAANTSYNKAGAVKRLFLGNHYRKEWAEPVAVKILDLDSVGGGLTPIKTGGGHQTKSLRLQGADGKEYVLRSVNKDPAKAMPQEFIGTFAEDVVKDQISSSNPYAPIVVASLSEAAGIFHTTPEVVFVPASARLDTFSKDFANTLCLFEERPSGNDQNNSAFDYSRNIINSEKLFVKLITDNTQHVDQKAFLKARLFDIWIGDWDRHQDQWVWAEFKGHNQTIYKPIPRDRDQAFAKLDGILPSMASKPWMIRSTKNFGYTVRDVQGLAMSAALLDHNFLTELPLNDWLLVAEKMKQDLTDKKIEDAFKLLPGNIYALSGQEIVAKLKKRRDDLNEYAKDYYYFLSKQVNIVGTEQKELFEVKRINYGSTKLAVYRIDQSIQRSQIIYERVFKSSETKEIRLYGFGGNDQFNISGETGKSILIRVIGGQGKDSVVDQSSVSGWASKTKVYDNSENTFTTGHELSRHISQDTLKNNYTKASLKYDWFSPKFAPGYNPDDGVYLGGGIIFKKQQFGKVPYGYMQSLWGNYAFETGAYNFWYEGIFKETIGKWDLHLNAQLNAPNYVLNYYGEGNETIKYEQVKNYYRIRSNQLIVSPSLARQFGKHQSVNIGLNYESVKIERSDNRYVTDIIGKLDSSIFSRKHFAGASVKYQFNTTDNAMYPRKGIRVNSGVEFTQNIKESKTNFTTVSSDVSFFISYRSLTAAFRVGGATNIGSDYEFYQANTLGGTSNLRGFSRSRYAGKSSLYQNMELRYKFQNIDGYLLKGNWGLLAFFDNGRVWIPNESSNTWHYGYGGGIWFLPYNKIAFTATYGVSKEDKLLNVKAGFFF